MTFNFDQPAPNKGEHGGGGQVRGASEIWRTPSTACMHACNEEALSSGGLGGKESEVEMLESLMQEWDKRMVIAERQTFPCPTVVGEFLFVCLQATTASVAASQLRAQESKSKDDLCCPNCLSSRRV